MGENFIQTNLDDFFVRTFANVEVVMFPRFVLYDFVYVLFDFGSIWEHPGMIKDQNQEALWWNRAVEVSEANEVVEAYEVKEAAGF